MASQSSIASGEGLLTAAEKASLMRLLFGLCKRAVRGAGERLTFDPDEEDVCASCKQEIIQYIETLSAGDVEGLQEASDRGKAAAKEWLQARAAGVPLPLPLPLARLDFFIDLLRLVLGLCSARAGVPLPLMSSEARALAVKLALSPTHRMGEKCGFRIFPGSAQSCYRQMLRLIHPDKCSDPRATEAVKELQSFEPCLSNADPESLRQQPMSDLETLLDQAIQPELKQSGEPEPSQPASQLQPAATGFVLEVGAFGRGSAAPAVPAVRKGVPKPKAASPGVSLDKFMKQVAQPSEPVAESSEPAKVAQPSEPAKVARPSEPVAQLSEPVAQLSEPVAERSEPVVAEPSEPVAEPSEPVAEPSEPVALCSESAEQESAEEPSIPEPFENGKLGEPLKEYRDHVVARQEFEKYGPDCPQEAVDRFRKCLYRDEKDAANFNPLEFPARTGVGPLPEWNGAMAFALRWGDPTNFMLVSKNKGVAVRAENVFKVKKDCLAELFSIILQAFWQRGNIRIFDKAAYYTAKDQDAVDFSPRADRFGGDSALRTRKRKATEEEYIYQQRESLNKLRKAVDDEKEARAMLAKSTLSIADFNYETCQCWYWDEPSGCKKSVPLDEAVATAIQTRRTIVLYGPPGRGKSPFAKALAGWYMQHVLGGKIKDCLRIMTVQDVDKVHPGLQAMHSATETHIPKEFCGDLHDMPIKEHFDVDRRAILKRMVAIFVPDGILKNEVLGGRVESDQENIARLRELWSKTVG
ncbi:unnamed protein product [Symbiodinium sp. CCMP2592]|nr:unnamed protein product [Symbiodinium sp. CCMP2592]